MGNKLATHTATADFYLHDLDGIIFDSCIGDGRVLKTLKCMNDEGMIVVKVHVKRPPFTNLKPYAQKFADIAIKNVYPTPQWTETEKAAYLIRQYFAHNLDDRIGTRPFLRTIEKQWIAYQLLCALKQIHDKGVCHGDIKCENVMVTSWMWLYLTDFPNIWKPSLLPETPQEDVSYDFSYFFDSSGTRKCNLAPERICSEVPDTTELLPSHDIFSAGCVIAQLFLDGAPLFTFSELLAYRKGTYDVESVISRIRCTSARKLVSSMVSVNPADRLSASEYLEQWHTTFSLPSCFTTLRQYVHQLMKMAPENQVHSVSYDFQRLLGVVTGDPSMVVASPLTSTQAYAVKLMEGYEEQLPQGGVALLNDIGKFVHQLERNYEGVKRVISGFDDQDANCTDPRTEDDLSAGEKDSEEGNDAEETLSRDGETNEANETGATVQQDVSADSVIDSTNIHSYPVHAFTIVLSVICSSMRDLPKSSSKVLVLDLFNKISEIVDDRCRLQRLVPYTVLLLSDRSPFVRALSITTLTSILSKIHSFSSTDSHVFPEYILPSLQALLQDPEEIVRQSLAFAIARLAATALRFLETAQTLKIQTLSASLDEDLDTHSTESHIESHASGLTATETYDQELHEIREWFRMAADCIFKDSSVNVRRSFLCRATQLASFFGQEMTSDFLIPRLIAVLNEREWELRYAFFEPIVGISEYVGMEVLELFIYPCLLQGLRDQEELVVTRTIDCLCALCAKGLFRKSILFEVILRVTPLLCHPNVWLRYGVIGVLSESAKTLDPCEIYCFLIPAVRPFLTGDIVAFDDHTLLESVREPLDRLTFVQSFYVCSKLLSSNSTSPSTPAPALSQSPPIIPSALLLNVPFVPEGILPHCSPLISSPRDPLVENIAAELSANGISGETLVTAVLMIPYFRTLTKSQSESRFLGSKFSSAPAELDDYVSPSSNLPVHSVRLPYSSSIEHTAEEEDWKILCAAQRKPATSAFPEAIARTAAKKLQSPRQIAENLSHSLIPPPLPDFGALRRLSDGANAPTTLESLHHWKPKGSLISSLKEHTGAITQVVASADNQFFASASEDGTVKLWDCQRLEKNVTNRSRLTYVQGGKVRCLTMIENSHTIASGSDNGSIHISRVEYGVSKKGLINYHDFTIVKQLDHPDEAVMAIDHFNTASQSVLVYASSKGVIRTWDLRCNDASWSMKNDTKAGVIQCMLVDERHNWLCVGTNRGCYTCWDIRFNLPLNSWYHPKPSAHGVVALAPYHHPSSSAASDAWLWGSAGDNEIYLWDLGTGLCRQLVRVLHEPGVKPFPTLGPARAPPHPRDFQDSASRMHTAAPAGSFANGPVASYTNVDSYSGGSGTDHAMRAVLAPRGCPYLLTGGTDCHVRYWDLAAASFGSESRSYVVCGERKNTAVSYTTEMYEDIVVHSEELGLSDHASSNVRPKRAYTTAYPSPLHTDVITSMCVIEQPLRAIISASRDGVIKVWR